MAQVQLHVAGSAQALAQHGLQLGLAEEGEGRVAHCPNLEFLEDAVPSTRLCASM